MTRVVMLLAVCALLSCAWIGCGSGESATAVGPEERFAKAKALFDKRDYLEAISEFTVITLQYQGSAVAADAQYYLGECRFGREEFLLAAFEYSVLKRNYSASARVADAQYKLALSYYRMSPKSFLDQQYTKKAIDELQTFVEYYPSHPSAPDAEAKIRELNTRLAKKAFETAQLYATMQYYKSALFYYDNVIEKYHDTEYAPLSHLAKTEVLMSRRRYREAEAEVAKFIAKYPDSVLRGRADALRKAVNEYLHSEPQTAPGTEAGPSRPTPGLSSVPGDR